MHEIVSFSSTILGGEIGSYNLFSFALQHCRVVAVSAIGIYSPLRPSIQ